MSKNITRMQDALANAILTNARFIETTESFFDEVDLSNIYEIIVQAATPIAEEIAKKDDAILRLRSGEAGQRALITILEGDLAKAAAEISRLRAESARWQDLLDANVSELGKRIKALTEENERLRAELAASEARIEKIREALAFYKKNVALCRLVHSGGDVGRNALDRDGGKIASAALAEKPTP